MGLCWVRLSLPRNNLVCIGSEGGVRMVLIKGCLVMSGIRLVLTMNYLDYVRMVVIMNSYRLISY